MAGIDVGGDASVEWFVEDEHARRNPERDSAQHPSNPKGWKQHGVDENDQPGDFTICIQIPDNRDAFLSGLQAAIRDVGNKKALCFTLPIVPNQKGKQINISWKSRP